MRIHHLCLAAAGLLMGPVHAQAQTATVISPGHWGGPFGQWYGGWQPEVMVTVPVAAAASAPPAPQGQAGYDRESWLRECHRRMSGQAPGPDRCEAMLAAPTGYAYAVPVMLVPAAQAPAGVPVQPGAARPCKETVVTEEFYEAVPRRARHIPRRAGPDKRVRLAPDKRIAP